MMLRLDAEAAGFRGHASINRATGRTSNCGARARFFLGAPGQVGTWSGRNMAFGVVGELPGIHCWQALVGNAGPREGAPAARGRLIEAATPLEVGGARSRVRPAPARRLITIRCAVTRELRG